MLFNINVSCLQGGGQRGSLHRGQNPARVRRRDQHPQVGMLENIFQAVLKKIVNTFEFDQTEIIFLINLRSLNTTR